jgi:putative ABC transport system permease protein
MRSFWRLLRGEGPAQELADEMREHLAERVADLVDSGMPRAAAEAEARRRFGNSAALADRSRDQWGLLFVEYLARDLRYAARSLGRNPFFAAVVVLPLALGIGANTAIFTVFHAALIRSLPYHDPDRLVHLYETSPGENAPHEASFLDYQDWRTASRNFEGFAAYTAYGPAATFSENQQPEQLQAAGVTGDFFPLLGVHAAMGRLFEPGDDQPGRAPAVVVSYAFWRQRLACDPAAVGRHIVVNSQPLAILGVLPRGFHFAAAGDAELWFPLVGSPQQRASRYWHWMRPVARLKPGAALEQAQAEMAAIADRIASEDAAHHAGSRILVRPLRETFVGPVRPVLLALLGAIAMVLLLACANVANLLLARASARRKEMAVRGSLGAGRGRLVQQLLTENLLLALLGGGLGLAVARWGIAVLVASLPADMRSHMPFLDGLTLHWGMLAFTAAVSIASGALFGLTPALRLSAMETHAALESGRRATGGREQSRLRDALLTVEVAISVVLLAGAGLMVKSTLRLLSVNPGFDPHGLLTMEVSLPRKGYDTAARVLAFHDRMLERLGALPGVRAAGTTSVLPLTDGGNTGTLRVEGRPDTAEKTTVYVRTVSPGYLRALGIPLLAGRGFDARDIAGATRVVVVNHRLALSAFAGEDPVGKRIYFPWSGGMLQIVGVAGDENTVSLDTELRPVVYFPFAQGPNSAWGLIVRGEGPPATLAGAVRRALRAMESEAPVYAVRAMDQVIAESPATVQRRYPALLMGSFAAIALVMAVIGIYSLVAYGVTRRVHEIGVRIALGARPKDILRLTMSQGILPALAGIAAGLVCAALLTRGLARLLFGVTPLDPATFAAVSAVLLGAALAASFIPAQRATRLPPGVALGSE